MTGSAGPLWGALLGLLAAALFGLSAPLAKLLLSAAGPLVVSGLLYLGGGVGLAAAGAILRLTRGPGPEAAIRRGDLWLLAGIIVAGGIVALLPSRTLISAMEDVLSGFPVTGTARLFAVLLHTFGLIVGVAGGLGLCLQVGGWLDVGLTPPPLDKLAWASAASRALIRPITAASAGSS